MHTEGLATAPVRKVLDCLLQYVQSIVNFDFFPFLLRCGVSANSHDSRDNRAALTAAAAAAAAIMKVEGCLLQYLFCMIRLVLDGGWFALFF